MFYTAFTCAPIFVAVISFFTYIMTGHEMTVSVAFTVRSREAVVVLLKLANIHTTFQSITLFNMVR
jgi:hypothetical protein